MSLGEYKKVVVGENPPVYFTVGLVDLEHIAEARTAAQCGRESPLDVLGRWRRGPGEARHASLPAGIALPRPSRSNFLLFPRPPPSFSSA